MHTLVADADTAERLLMTQDWTFAGVLPNNKVILHKRPSEKGPEPNVGMGPREPEAPHRGWEPQKMASILSL